MTRQREPDDADLRAQIQAAERWAQLRAGVIQAVLDLHAPVDVDQVWGPMEVNYLPPLVCGECGTPFPCNTRKVVFDRERQSNH